MYTNIKKENDKYIIEKRVYGQIIEYGRYDRIEDALKQKEVLKIHKWIKNNTTGYDKKEHFPRYCVREDDNGKYIVKNTKNGKTFGSYKNKKYARIIKNILPFYIDKIDIERVEQQATREFYKYISFDAIHGYYRFRYNNMTIETSYSLAYLLEERDIYLRSGGDEEMMCDIQKIYTYDEEELPPFFLTDNIIYEEKSKNKYVLRKQIRSKRLKIGAYQTYELALAVKDYLKNNDWKMDIINHIKDITYEIQNRNKNIIKKDDLYYIYHSIKKKRHYYGSYKSIHIARFVRDKLKESNWNKNEVKNYEKEYYSHKKSQYYYDTTDILASI